VPSRFVVGGDPLDSDFAMAYAVYACSQGLCDGLKTKSVEVKAAKEAYRDNNVLGKRREYMASKISQPYELL
jgi:hypothetical protein